MSWTDALDVLGAVAILLGAALALIAAIGLVRFDGLFMRMHAATKPQTLGLFLVLTGLALTLRSWSAFGTLVLVAFAQALTAPVSAHMLSRVAYRTKLVGPQSVDADELDRALRETSS